MSSSKEKRIIWLDIIRIVACFSVIANHYIDAFIFNSIDKLTGFNFIFYIVQLCFSKIAVPLFFMITGVLLLKKEYTYKDVLKKIIRILVPLIIATILISYTINWIGPYSFKDFFIEPIFSVFWYLYVLIGLYLMTPILQKMIKSLKSKQYIYMFILCFIVPGIINYLNFVFNIKISHYFSCTFFSPLIVYYVIGVFLTELEKNKKNKVKAWVLLLSSSLIYIITFLILYSNDKEIYTFYTDCSNIFVGLISVSIFYLFRYYFEGIKTKIDKFISSVSLTTFGIYFFHMIVQLKLTNSVLITKIFDFSPIIALLLAEILSFSICSIITFLLRKIPLVRRFL